MVDHTEVPSWFFLAYPDVPHEVLRVAYELSDTVDYADSFRFAKESDPTQVAEFRAAEERGCCGSWNGELLVDGVLWLYGFQYGH